jgi:hypothetical protein
MVQDDDKDSKELGVVGTFSDEMTTEALFWRLVCNLRLSLKEVDSWTMGEMRMADAYMSMQNDYKRIWPTYYNIKKEEETEVEDEAEAILEKSNGKVKV